MRTRHVSAALLALFTAYSATPSAQTALGPAPVALSGTIAHGATVTINGSGFGTKTTAAPLRWDNFEAGTNATRLSGWDLYATYPGTEPSYSTQVLRPNSRVSARSNFTGGSWDSNFGVRGVPLPQLYLDAWYYYDVSFPYPRNHKLFRIISDNPSAGGWGTPNLYFNLYCNAVGASHLSQDGVDAGNYHKWLELHSGQIARRWVHVQGYFRESSPGVDDGVAMLWIDGVQQINDTAFRTRNGSTRWNMVWLGHFLGHESDSYCAPYGDAHTYWDDVYLDTTQARVEIGNASTYAASTHREIQLPVSWSDTSVQVRLNKGSHADFSNLYLYVTDANGRVNSTGLPLAATAPPPPTAPSAPTNLRIVRIGS